MFLGNLECDVGELFGTRMTFKSFEIGSGSKMSDEKLTILEFKYLQKKKWYKQAVKSPRTRKSSVFISFI